MKVRATQQGFYFNVLIEPGQVFELEKNPDGSDPVRMVKVPMKDSAGKVIPRKFKLEPWKDENGNTMHRDFAPSGDSISIDGDAVDENGKPLAFAGETFEYGWMEQVPDSTPVDVEPPEFVYDGVRPVSRAKFLQAAQAKRGSAKPAQAARR